MAAATDTTASKIKIGDENYFLIVTWREPIIFELVYKDQTWTGKFSKEEMEPYYTNLGVSMEKYTDHTKKLITGKLNDNEMIFELKDNFFAWKKVIDKSYGMIFVHGGLKMCYSESGGTELLADKLFALRDAAEKRLYQNSDELDKVYKQLKSLGVRMDEMIFDKNKMEEDIYNKFLSLLNSKKIKINELEEFLKENMPSNRKDN